MTNDYYVEFGSNARPWAKGLRAELAPAREAVQEVLDMLATMESKVGPETTRTRQELGRRFGGGGTGGGTAGENAPDMSTLRVAVHELADESAAAGALIKTAAIDLTTVITKIGTLPAAIERSVASSMSSMSNSIARLVELNTGAGKYHVPGQRGLVTAGTPGAVQHGSIQGEFFKTLREIRQGTFQPRLDLTPRPSIATVSAAALDRAGVDRIVYAVRAQTRVLSADIRGLGGRPPSGPSGGGPTGTTGGPAGPTTPPTGSGRPSGSARTPAAAVEAASQSELEVLQARLRGQDDKIRAIYKAVGATMDDATKALVAELEQGRQDVAAEVRRLERETTGITHAEQSKRASAAFQAEQAARPVLTDVERDTRNRKAALLASPGQEDFLYKASRPPGVARAQRYNEDDLKEMAKTFREFGVAVGNTTKTSKKDLAELLVQAHKTFAGLYPEGLPDELRTDGARITRTTKVGDELKSVLGDLNADVVEQRKRDLAAMSQNLLTGGDKAQTSVRQQRLNDGTIVVPEEMVKGRRGFGAAISEDVRHPDFPDAAIGKIAGLIDAATVRAAEQRMQTDPSREMARAVANPGFNPYDVRLNRSIEQGQGEDEKAVAGAYRQRLRDLRAAYAELDKAGTEFKESANLLKVLDDKLVRANDKLRQASRIATPDDFEGPYEERKAAAVLRNYNNPGRAEEAQQEIGDLRRQQDQVLAHMQQLGANGRAEIFNNPAYQAGLAQREGFAGIPFAPGLGARQIFEKNRDELPASSSLSDARLLRSATQAAVVGLQTANGTRELMKAIPGLRRRGEGLGADESVGRPLTGKEQQQLDSAFNALSSLQRKVLPNRTTVPGDAEREMDLKLEQAANHFNNVIERLFKSASLPLQAFTGQDPRTQEALIDEERRRTLREQREAERTKSVAQIRADQTPAYKKQQADLAVENARQALQTATERRATASTLDSHQQGHAGRESGLAEATEREAAAEKDLRAAAEKAGISTQELTRAMDQWVQATEAAFQKQLKANKLIEARRRIEDVANYDPKTGEAQTTKLGIPGHGFGPVKTLDDYLGVIDQQVEQMSRQHTEMVRRKGEGKAVVDEELTASLDRARTEQAQISKLRDEFGGSTPLTALVERLDKEAQKERDAARKAVPGGLGGLVSSYQDSYQVLEAAQREVDGLTASLKKAEAAADKAARALDRDTKKRLTEADARRKELSDVVATERAKRQAIRDEGKYTRTDKKAAFQRGGLEDPEYQAIAERQRRLRRQELNVQTAERDLAAHNRANPIPKAPRAAAGGAAGGGGAKPPAPPGATPPGGDDDNELRRILAVLNQIHSTLKGTLRVTGKISEGRGPAAPKPGGDVAVGTPTAESRARTPRTRNETVVAIEEERQVQRQRTLANVRAKNTEAEEKDARKAAKAVEAQATADREAARAAEDLAAAVGQLSPSTLREIEVLRQLTAASKNATTAQEREAASKRIGTQQIKAAAGIDADLYNRRIGSAGRRDATRVVLNRAGPALAGGELDSVLKSVRSANPKRIGQGLGAEMGEGAVDGFQRVFGGGSSFWARALHTTGTFVVRNFAAGFVFGLTNYFQQILDQAIQAEATFVRVRSALESTGQDLGNIRADLQGISTDYGVQLNDVYTAAAGLTGLFDNENDLAAGTRVVAQLQAISGGALNATEATGVLASTISAFQRQAGETGDASRFLPDDTVEAVQHVADVLTTIQNTLGVNIETSAEGASRLAGLAREMSLSFEETAVFAAQIAKQTNQTGAAAGEQFSRIIGGIQSGRGRSALLEAFNPGTSTASQQAISQVRGGLDDANMGQVLRGLIAGWDDLSTSQQRNLIVSIAGQRQAAAFSALLSDSSKTLNALERAENSTGAAAERMDDLMKTLNKRLDKFGSEVQTLASNLIQAGLLDFLGVLLVGVTEILDVVNKLLTAFNQMTDDNGALDQLRNFIAILLGGLLGLKLFGAGLRGVSGAINGLRGGALGAASRAAEQATAPPRNSVRYGPGGVREEATGAGRYGIANRFVGGADSSYYRLQTMAVEKEREAQRLRSIYQDQQLRQRFGPSYVPTPKLGAAPYGDRELTQRTSRPDPRLLQEANSAERVGRAAAAAGNGMGRVANGLDKMAKSGLAAEAAMALLFIGLAAFFDSQNRHAEQTKSFREGYEKLTKGYLVQTPTIHESSLALFGLAEAAKEFNANAPDPNRFYGPTYENYKNRQNQLRDQGMAGQAFAGIGAVLNNPGAFFGNLGGGIGGGDGGLTSAYKREFGLESRANGGYQAYGTDDRQRLLQEGTQNLDLATTADAVTKASEEYHRRLAEEAVKIKNDKSLSDGEREAALGQLEIASTLFSDLVGNQRAIYEGAKNAIGLSVADVEGIQTLVQTRQAIGSQVNANGLDLGPYLQSLAENTGAANEPGSATRRMLDKIRSQNSDSIDILMANRSLLKESIINMTNDLKELQDNNQGDSDEAQRISSVLGSLIQQYGQANDGIQDALNAQADSMAAMFEGENKPGQAMQVYSRAALRAKRLFDQETRAIRQAFRLAKRAWLGIQSQANRVEALIGEGTGGATPFTRNGFGKAYVRGLNAAEGERKRAFTVKQQDKLEKQMERKIFQATKALTLQISQTVDQQKKQSLEAARQAIILGIVTAVNNGEKIPGLSGYLTQNFGPGTVTDQELLDQQVATNEARLSATQADEDAGQTAAQRAAALKQAQLGVAQAWADARGDAVASARIQVAIARATIAAAQADLAAAKTADETNAARISILNAQAQLIAAHAAVQAAQTDLVQSQYDVSIALADAAGNTVKSARLTLAAARRALADALRKSGGEATAEVNAARVEAINARAALQDAELQDQLDTVDFNLQMGKITQQSAIQALQQILRTSDLNKQQRRQLLLQIKGMKDELSDSQWNFGDISLPTPYQMKRYITERRNQFRNELDQAAGSAGGTVGPGGRPGGTIIDRPPRPEGGTTSTSTTTITIDGADTGMIKRLIREVVGDSTAINTRTTGARRGGVY